MARFDPRLWSIANPWRALLLFGALTSLMLWGNVRLQRGGMFADDVILHADDPYRQMDHYVREKAVASNSRCYPCRLLLPSVELSMSGLPLGFGLARRYQHSEITRYYIETENRA